MSRSARDDSARFHTARDSSACLLKNDRDLTGIAYPRRHACRVADFDLDPGSRADRIDSLQLQ